jgi:geranylgeranyl transferase type-2 subunit beta
LSEPYLLQLAIQLATGLAKLPEESCARHRAYLRAAQNEDGGFSGREGGSDLYYTGFGLRGLVALDALAPEVCHGAASFLRASLARQTSVVDFFSLLYAAALIQAGGGPDVFADSAPGWEDRVARELEIFRTPDGGYGKTVGTAAGSTYHTFLVGLCYQLLGRPIPMAQQAVGFILSRRREDGGFVEVAPMRRGGTNPTAAAIGLLQMVQDPAPDGARLAQDGLSAEVRQEVVDFLTAMPSPEGGFRANGRAPLADLLSTFTGLWTLQQLQALDRVDAASALGYVKLLELPGGGFRGGLWDDRTDVEYTFYGLGCLALLTPDAG